MKKIFTLLIILATLNISAQEESVLDLVAKETCEYLQSEEIQLLSNNDKTMKLGVFIITKYSEYEDRFKAEGIDFDLSNGAQNAGRQFGEKVGITMVKYCPEVLMALGTDDNTNKYEEDEYAIQGKINSIEGNEFSTIIVKDSSGKMQKFLWMENFSGSEKLINNVSVEGLKVEVIYKNFECYSPQLKEYVIRKKIIAIDFLDQ